MVEELLEKIGNLTLVEASDLVKQMEEKFGISSAAPVAVVTAEGSGNAAVEKEEEQTEFEVYLDSFDGAKKVDAIKKVREFSGLPLMDAKKAVEGGDISLKSDVSKEEAEAFKKDAEVLGLKISLK